MVQRFETLFSIQQNLITDNSPIVVCISQLLKETINETEGELVTSTEGRIVDELMYANNKFFYCDRLSGDNPYDNIYCIDLETREIEKVYSY